MAASLVAFNHNYILYVPHHSLKQSSTFSLRTYLQSERKMKETRISQSLILGATEARVTNHLEALHRKR